MNTILSPVRLSRPAFWWATGVLALIVAIQLLSVSTREIAAMRDTSLPLLATVPALEQRIALLREQVDVAELDATLRSGSQSERIRVSVLPKDPPLDRAIALLNLLRDDLVGRHLLHDLAPIETGTETIDNTLTMLPLRTRWTVRGEGMRSILSFLRLSGLLTVGDALTQTEKSALIRATEEENPAGIVALEQFFATDLQSYAAEPRPFEEQLRRSLPGDGFRAVIEPILAGSHLTDARTLFQSKLGKAIVAGKLWPMPFMDVSTVETSKGQAEDWYTMNLTVMVMGRGE